MAVHRPIASRARQLAALAVCAVALVPAATPLGQEGAASLTLLSREGRRSLPISSTGGQPYVGLDDLAAAFQLTVREEAGAITVTYRGQTIVLTLDRTLASAAGRLVSLPAPPRRAGGRVQVPLDFISRVLGPVYAERLDLRRDSRLLVIGDLRVPRVTVGYDPRPNAARVAIDITPGAASTVTERDGRLTVRIDADALDVSIPAVEPGLVQAIRAVDPVTLALDTGSDFSGYQARTQALGSAERVIIDLTGAVAAATLTLPAPAPEAAPADPADPLPLFASGPAPIRTVVIDPGHGGDDLGVRAPNGLLEKDLTLAVARRLRASLETRLGLRVLLTRDDDRFVPIDRRAAVANNNKAGVFISLHANASPRESARGAAIYVAAFEEEAQARASLARERVSVVGGGARDLELLYWDVAQIRHVDRSWQFATLVEEQFAGRVPLDERPVARMPFRVLESANMPAVLIEMGYLTNLDQAGRLAGGDLQGAVAQAVADALVRFRGAPAGEAGEP